MTWVYFFKEDTPMVSEHLFRYPTLLVIRETEVETTLRNPCTLTRMATMRQTIASGSEDAAQLQLSCVICTLWNGAATQKNITVLNTWIVKKHELWLSPFIELTFYSVLTMYQVLCQSFGVIDISQSNRREGVSEEKCREGVG